MDSKSYFGEWEKRYKEHCSGHACRTTKIDPPVALLYWEEFETFIEARKREAQIKRWSRSKKKLLWLETYRGSKYYLAAVKDHNLLPFH